jgi:DNA-binding NarL/FixJ family response regulator
MTVTKRELAIAKLVSAGWANRQIAYELGISACTVKQHFSRRRRG